MKPQRPFAQIRTMRERHGLTTTQFAYRLGVNQSTVIRLEQSEQRKAISLLSLERAAQALDCELEYLLVPRNTKEHFPEKKSRRHSELNDEMSSHVLANAKRMSPKDRLRRAFELSDFAWKLHQCSKR